MGVNVQQIPTFCAVRWLSLGELVNAVSKMWTAIESFFRGPGAENSPKIIRKIFKDDDFSKSSEYHSLVTFFAFILDEFNRVNLKTQVPFLICIKKIKKLIFSPLHFR